MLFHWLLPHLQQCLLCSSCVSQAPAVCSSCVLARVAITAAPGQQGELSSSATLALAASVGLNFFLGLRAGDVEHTTSIDAPILDRLHARGRGVDPGPPRDPH